MESAGLSGGTWSNKDYTSVNAGAPPPPAVNAAADQQRGSGGRGEGGVEGTNAFFSSSSIFDIDTIYTRARERGKIE